ncbi:MAG: sel1 repeat family protein [Rhodospirillaceae bacterium]|jgi:TPR repeat protein|nr:sel1 repeat family protein [Rhodospirillaceae bacterium]MBT3885844.1 sel1 repeat family protein [Rhodospirillaceae bacterium]MBT4115170.1 sel1 repeat family protein [Rhodospirillaceae bacterium]MBT4670508.1 sel1 repeat family protein [Rhodospirillaceae bacterium]MBT4748083.1 sel1 repeat family protein [Rhodospirillaceae bacterium]
MGHKVFALSTAFCIAAFIAAAPLRAQDGDQLQIGKRAYESRQFETAFKVLKPLAVGGNAEAQLMIGDMYNLGAGVGRDNSAAIEWYRKSAMQGNGQAIEMLGQGMRLFGESTN